MDLPERRPDEQSTSVRRRWQRYLRSTRLSLQFLGANIDLHHDGALLLLRMLLPSFVQMNEAVE